MPSRSCRRRSSGTSARLWRSTTSRSATSARTRCGWRACTDPTCPIHATKPPATRAWAARCRGRSARSSRTRAACGGGNGRCGLHDVLAGDRVRRAAQVADGDPDLERRRVWPHRMETDGDLWTAGVRALQQPGLREVRRVVRRERLSGDAGRGTHAYFAASPLGRRGKHYRLSGRLYRKSQADRQTRRGYIPVMIAFTAPVIDNMTEFSSPVNAKSRLRLLTYNIQAAVASTRPHHYLTRSWKHVLPHPSSFDNLDRIARLITHYDVVAIQEADAGSLRSYFTNQVEYLARQRHFPFWCHQTNRDLGKFAQNSNGLLSKLQPSVIAQHKLPGLIPGRGAMVVRFGQSADPLILILVHLALGRRARERQIDFLSE